MSADVCWLWTAAVDAIARTPAMTRAGLVAKAAKARQVLGHYLPALAGRASHKADRHEAFAWSLVNDVLRVG
jgi:hypothetical protein